MRDLDILESRDEYTALPAGLKHSPFEIQKRGSLCDAGLLHLVSDGLIGSTRAAKYGSKVKKLRHGIRVLITV